MIIGARGLTASLVFLLLCLGACAPTQHQQTRAPAPAAASPADDEPVPMAAPRAPVETEVVPPPARRS